MTRRVLMGALALVAAALVSACSGSGKPADPGAKGPLKVVCTTRIIADTVRQLAGESVEVQSLMGPGVDPHLYKATASDVVKLRGADLVFYNGLHLEGKMIEVLESLGKQKPVIAVGDSVDKSKLLTPPEFQGLADPHIWFDVSMWLQAADGASDALVRHDPAHADEYRQRAARLGNDLSQLHEWCLQQAATVPRERRVLVTSHDAFNYFGRAYGFEVVGLQGISTVTEAGTSDVAQMVDLIKARRIPAVFVESSVPKAAIERVSEDSGARIGGELFSDSMGAPGTPQGTYQGMIRHNVGLVVEALK
ncbi:MAG: zinc ABC transporter substrate-binding protein [Armatimonadetes bacterium]|nr:zinc ABC transporter substrate-binding protein [Armatimonadota bacterium]